MNGFDKSVELDPNIGTKRFDDSGIGGYEAHDLGARGKLLLVEKRVDESRP
jgi:hypothetical protein